EAPDLELCEPLVSELLERPAPPERERLVQLRGGGLRIDLFRLLEERVETINVELIAFDPEEVPRCFRLDALLAQHSAQLRDVDLECLPSRFGRLLAPECVDQAVGRDNLVRIQQQHGEQAPLFRTAHVERSLAVEHLERTENPKLHRSLPRADRSTGSEGAQAATRRAPCRAARPLPCRSSPARGPCRAGSRASS